MKRFAAAVAVALLVAAAATAIGAPVAATATDLTDTGDGAVDDLRECLAANDALNVFYLIDNSGSLEGGPSTPATDPDVDRAEILGNSLAQLDALEVESVHWAAGFFNDVYVEDPNTGWQPWSPTSHKVLETAIHEAGSGGRTDWLAGFHGAEAALDEQPIPDEGEACQLVVWFTDGALNIDDDVQKTADTLNDLCGQQIDPAGHQPTEKFGVISDLRDAGVVILATLMADVDADTETHVMWPLVEGSGEFRNAQETCGNPKPPAQARRGAVVPASDTTVLARVFLELASRIAGGYPNPIEAGRFFVDAGVSRFQLALGKGWTLTPPGSNSAPLTEESPGPMQRVSGSGDATLFEVSTTDPALQGEWTLSGGGDVDSVFLFSDLSIVFDEDSAPSGGEEGIRVESGSDGELTGQIRRLDGSNVSLDVYASPMLTTRIEADGLPREDLIALPASGEFTIPYSTETSAAQIVVKTSIDNLRTAEHGLTMGAVIGKPVSITIDLPKDFPQIVAVPVDLGMLDGVGRATGYIELVSPPLGGNGEACVSTSPQVIGDTAGRPKTSWTWGYDLGPTGDGCFPVEEGAGATEDDADQRIRIWVEPDQAAAGSVTATVTVTFTSSSGEERKKDVPIRFATTHQVDPLWVSLLLLALLLLGILLPLVALWLLNWRTTRLDIDTGIQRASFPVRIGPSGVALDAPSSDAALGERFQYRPPQRNVRSIDDPDLGRLAAHVPWFPLAEPTYRITPRPGTSIVGARTSARATSAGIRRDDGSMEFRQLPLDAFWAIVVSNAELARTTRGDEVSGTAVLYHRMDHSQQDQYRARLNDIALEGSLTDAVDRTRTAQADARSRAANRAPASTPIAPAGAAAAAPARDGAPPPRGGTTPPPRGTGDPGAGSAPPPRGGTTPPPLPGSPGSSGSASPPRPGTSPPPRGR